MRGVPVEGHWAADCANSRHLARVSPNPTSERRERLMHSVPAPPDSAPPRASSPVESDPLSWADGCPECVLNVEPPRSVVELTNGFRNAYLCSDCGHAWTTDWRE